MERALHMPSGSGGVEERYIATARAELEELLAGFREFMRRERLPLWDKEDPLTKEIRALAYHQQRTLALYRPYLETADMASNCALSLIHQANFLLDQQVRSLQRRASRGRWAYRPRGMYR